MQLVDCDDDSNSGTPVSQGPFMTGRSGALNCLDTPKAPQYTGSRASQQPQLQIERSSPLRQPFSSSSLDLMPQLVTEHNSSAKMSCSLGDTGDQDLVAPASFHARRGQYSGDMNHPESMLELPTRMGGSEVVNAPITPGFAFHGSRATRVSTPGR
ncbi:hypothetical protein WJX84_011200 [Apatococcus fuscideae]